MRGDESMVFGLRWRFGLIVSGRWFRVVHVVEYWSSGKLCGAADGSGLEGGGTAVVVHI